MHYFILSVLAGVIFFLFGCPKSPSSCPEGLLAVCIHMGHAFSRFHLVERLTVRTNKMKKIILPIAVLSSMVGFANAATTLTGLTATASNDTTTGDGAPAAPGPGEQYGGGGLASLTNDGFAYDIDNPASVLPANTNVIDFFHGDHTSGQTVTIDFTVTSTAVSIGDILFVDLYGRNIGAPANARDNGIIVEFFDGVTSLGVTPATDVDASTLHGRAQLTLTTAGNVTGFRISGPDSGLEAANYFSPVELRAGIEAVPEPSSAALLGLGGLALIMRRRK